MGCGKEKKRWVFWFRSLPFRFGTVPGTRYGRQAPGTVDNVVEKKKYEEDRRHTTRR